MHDQYIPGACNIGKSEIQRRKQTGWIGLIIIESAFIGIVVAVVAYYIPK